MMRTDDGSAALKMALKHEPETRLLTILADDNIAEASEALEEVESRNDTVRIGSWCWRMMIEQGPRRQPRKDR